MIDVYVHMIDMPCGVRETVTRNDDDSYSIFIHSGLTREAQLEAYNHAMRHITGEDFSKLNVEEIEFETHKKEGNY